MHRRSQRQANAVARDTRTFVVCLIDHYSGVIAPLRGAMMEATFNGVPSLSASRALRSLNMPLRGVHVRSAYRDISVGAIEKSPFLVHTPPSAPYPLGFISKLIS